MSRGGVIQTLGDGYSMDTEWRLHRGTLLTKTFGHFRFPVDARKAAGTFFNLVCTITADVLFFEVNVFVFNLNLIVTTVHNSDKQ